MRRFVFLLPLILVAALAAGFAALLIADRRPEVIPSALIGMPAPEMALPAIPNLEGVEGFSGADLKGQVTVVNFFASWCLPCLAEHPLIASLAANGHHVYGIDYRDPEPDGLEWLIRNGNPYARVGADFDARAGLEWGVTGVPETFIIDAGGIIRHKHSGPLTARTLEREIMPILRDLAK
ncbi:MAG: DsbE family thiol:disulfide interchange protein [Alphaproteobacteria bacterium]|nr:DsbE family thiol:disulfide interchange protein [Alphaproteobacteria bacterium]MCZ6763475.1 DsbE family thiol:disulfide interchange protein [Alphaproteobacteria bacterium]